MVFVCGGKDDPEDIESATTSSDEEEDSEEEEEEEENPCEEENPQPWVSIWWNIYNYLWLDFIIYSIINFMRLAKNFVT